LKGLDWASDSSFGIERVKHYSNMGLSIRNMGCEPAQNRLWANHSLVAVMDGRLGKGVSLGSSHFVKSMNDRHRWMD